MSAAAKTNREESDIQGGETQPWHVKNNAEQYSCKKSSDGEWDDASSDLVRQGSKYWARNNPAVKGITGDGNGLFGRELIDCLK